MSAYRHEGKRVVSIRVRRAGLVMFQAIEVNGQKPTAINDSSRYLVAHPSPLPCHGTGQNADCGGVSTPARVSFLKASSLVILRLSHRLLS